MARIYVSRILVILAVLGSCSAYGDSLRLLNVYIFGKVSFEIHDQDGRHVTSESPIFEYKEIDVWDSSDRAWSPDTIDLIFVSPAATNVVLKMLVFEKTGPLVANKESGLTDFEAGVQAARWSSAPITKKAVELASDSRPYDIVTHVETLDISGLIDKHWKNDEWLYNLKIEAWIVCDQCMANKKIEKNLTLYPMD